MHLYRLLAFLAVVACGLSGLHAEESILRSPNNRIVVTVNVGTDMAFSITARGEHILPPSSARLTLDRGSVPGASDRVVDVQRRSENSVVTPVVKEKRDKIPDVYNEMTLILKSGNAITWRAYNEGVAYRFETLFSGDVTVRSEEGRFRFAPEDTVFFPKEESFISHNERLYLKLAMQDLPPDSFCSLPALVALPKGVHVLIAEADLLDYPGMWLKVTPDRALGGLWPAVALEEKEVRDRDIIVTKRADYIAKTRGARTFPWRVFVVAEHDGDLLTNQMVYLLSSPSRIGDAAWIRPGKVAWDWWNALNVYGVDFRAGINTATYKYYIDFASRYNIEYIILDEGWYTRGDLLETNPDIDMPALLAYAREKHVGIILWCVWKTLEKQLQPALDRFQDWGIPGIKVDFMQRDDQAVVNYYEMIAREAAKRKMLVDFHGAYKPTGLRRTYPNVVTREGVRGLENVKWSDQFIPGHEVTIPFIRMVPGPMDYTPGAMVNAQKGDYRPIFTRPMSMGTRCRQLAMYVVYESPLQMLADNPSNYLREPACMEFLGSVPTVWDETRVLEASVGHAVAIARRSGTDWYIGVMTDESPRAMSLDFSFLGDGEFAMTSYQDGVNADRYGSDYRMKKETIRNGYTATITLAPAGGWAAVALKKGE